jgi:hypothetical protein
MRFLIIILLFSLNASAGNYYISNTGSDAANGTSTGTAWQTISKVNASTFAPGDSVLFKRGDTWSERLNVPSSGSYGDPIVFGAYGTGAKPIITGLEQATGFTNVGNIWTASIPQSVADLNTVIVNGAIRAKARTPNSTYYTFTSVNSYTQITTSLTGTPNYTGSEIVVRQASWIIDVTKVASQSGGVLNFVEPLTYNASYGANGYFFQNNVADLDVAGEWVFDSTAKTLKVYATTEPTVYISTIDTLVHSGGESYLTFDGISFLGANKAAIQLDTANHVTIQNCTFNYSGTLAISALKSTALHVLNDSIQNSLSGAIYARQVDPYTPMVNTCDSAIIDVNYINTTAIFKGMGMNGNGRYNAISIVGMAPQVTNNEIDSTGYIAVIFFGKNAYAYRNNINVFGLVKSDGGAIYTNIGGYLDTDYIDGTIIRSNIVRNGKSTTDGETYVGQNAGVFIDDGSRQVTADSNTLIDCYYSGMKIHGSSYITFKANTIFNTTGHGLLFQHYLSQLNNLNIKRNVVYNPNTTYKNAYIFLGGAVGTLDSNFYSRPSGESTRFNLNGTSYSLSGWQSATSQDAHSVGTPANATSGTAIIHYNATTSDSTISLSGYYTDMLGNVYNNSITLHPFSSAILFPIATPPTPTRITNRGFTKVISL